MKLKDLLFIVCLALLLSTFLPIGFLKNYQQDFLFNHSFWALSSFLKFAVLATLGELIALRIRSGSYNVKGFGLFPRAIVWGILGISIKLAFVIFTSGAPVILENYFGLTGAVASMKSPDILMAARQSLLWERLLTAFAISAFMNLIFAPIFMTFHRITDMHIVEYKGSLQCFSKGVKMGQYFQKIDWDIMWGFVFKKTIPFFWIPAHTLTFLMPPQYRIVMAALLGLILGVILSTASSMASKK